MNRRQFISRSAALLAAGSIVGCQSGNAKNKGRVGLQLYSVRKQLPDDVAGTLQKISEMGYSQVELYGVNDGKFFGHSMEDTRKMINDLGMSISSTHTGSGILPEDTSAPEWDFWKRIAGYLNTCGAEWAVASSLPGEMNTLDDLKLICAHFNRVGEVCKKEGVKFAFHNHTDVFGKIEDEVALDYMINNTEPNLVFFQMDMGHTVNGGGDCVYYIRNYPGRIPMWHASDFDLENSDLENRIYTWLGKGSVPYPALFELANASGLEVLTVEQETEVDTLAACKADFDYIKQFKWTQV